MRFLEEGDLRLYVVRNLRLFVVRDLRDTEELDWHRTEVGEEQRELFLPLFTTRITKNTTSPKKERLNRIKITKNITKIYIFLCAKKHFQNDKIRQNSIKFHRIHSFFLLKSSFQRAKTTNFGPQKRRFIEREPTVFYSQIVES